MPRRAGTEAIALRNTCCSPRHEGVALYEKVAVGGGGEHPALSRLR